MEDHKRHELDQILNCALDDLDDSSIDDSDNNDCSGDSRNNLVTQESNISACSRVDDTTTIPLQNTLRSTNGDAPGNDATETRPDVPVFGPVPPPPDDTSREEEALKEMMCQMESLLSSTGSNYPTINEDINKVTGVPQTHHQRNHIDNKKVQPKLSYNKSTKTNKKKSSESTKQQSSLDDKNSVDNTISKLLEQLTNPSTSKDHECDMSQNEFEEFEAMSANLMKEMEETFKLDTSSTNSTNGTKGSKNSSGKDHSKRHDSSSEGDDEAMDHLLNGMMNQLLNKDLMYEPMKDICEKYPEWLAKNKKELSDEDYQRYGHQYQYFQRIVAVYEHDPANIPCITELMHAIQE